MSRNNDNDTALFGNGDELPSNHSGNSHIDQLINPLLARRQVVAGGAALGALTFFGIGLPGIAAADERHHDSASRLFRRNRLPFTPVAVTRADTVSVPPGFTAKPFIPWGTPLTGSYPAFADDASNSAQDQAEQLGMHHDGMHFFPIDAQSGRGKRSDHGLLVLNHEYIDVELLHPNGPTAVDG